MISKKIILPVAAAVVIGATVLGVSQVQAQTSGGTSLAQMIAQKFGLDQSQVQSVIDQYRQLQKSAMIKNKQNRQKQRLDQLVSQGKITSAQEQAIIAEIQILQQKYSASSLKSETPAERKQAIQQEQTDAKNWATQNGIDPSYVTPFWMMGPRMGWHRGPRPSGSPSATPIASP